MKLFNSVYEKYIPFKERLYQTRIKEAFLPDVFDKVVNKLVSILSKRVRIKLIPSSKQKIRKRKGLNLFGQKFDLGTTKRAIRFNWSSKFGKSIHSVDFWLNSKKPQPSFSVMLIEKNINEILVIIEELIKGNLDLPEIEGADKEVTEDIVETESKSVVMGIDFEAGSFYYIKDKQNYDLDSFFDLYDMEPSNDISYYNFFDHLVRDYTDSRMDDDQEESILDAVIGDCARNLVSIFQSREFSALFSLSPDEECKRYMRKKPPDEVKKAIIKSIEEEQYWDNWDEHKFYEMCDELDLDRVEIKQLIKHNFDTGGQASRHILENFEDIESEEFSGLIKAMKVAQHRHMNTNYDTIDKKGMTSAQVAALRKSVR